MYLHEIYEKLGYAPNNYTRWSKNFLVDYCEGVNYTIEHDGLKKLYKLDDYLTLTALHNYSQEEELIWNTAYKCNTPLIVSLAKNTKDIKYFFAQLKRIINSGRDIPKGYSMPSEVKIRKKFLVAKEYIDEDYNLFDKGFECLKWRIIIKARGIGQHVIIKDSCVEQLLEEQELYKQELKELKAAAKALEAEDLEATQDLDYDL